MTARLTPIVGETPKIAPGDSTNVAHRLRLIGLFLAAVVSVAGCDGTDASVPTQFEPSDSTSPCPVLHPLELDVRALSVEGIEYLGTITACTNRGEDALWLDNHSDAVWTVDATSPVPVDQLTDSVRHTLFRDSAASIHPTAIMAPDTEVVVHASPADVSWSIHPGLSAMWVTQDGLFDLVQSYGLDQVTELAAASSPRRKALITCSVAAYEVIDGAEDALGETNPMEDLLTILGVGASTTACRSDWLKADDDALRRFGATATWADDVSRLADDASFLSQADTTLEWVHRGWRLMRLLP